MVWYNMERLPENPIMTKDLFIKAGIDIEDWRDPICMA
jgi:hypothetical protein